MGLFLENKVFISTRPAGQNSELKTLLNSKGAQLLELPTIEIRPSELSLDEEDMLEHINQFTWIVFTSPNGIRFFFKKLYEITGSYALPSSIKTAVVGKKTSHVLSEFGHESTLENKGTTAEDLAEELLKAINSDDVLLFPEGDMARQTVSEIASRHAECVNLVVYKNQLPKFVDKEILNKIIKNDYESIILTSPSCFINLISLLNQKTDIKKLKLVCIGTTTASEVIEKGIEPVATATMTSASGIVDAILENY